MSEHTCTTLTPGCYRCDLSRDEAIAAIAGEYWDEEIAPGLSSVPDDGLAWLRLQYLSDVRANERAVAELFAWAEERDDA